MHATNRLNISFLTRLGLTQAFLDIRSKTEDEKKKMKTQAPKPQNLRIFLTLGCSEISLSLNLIFFVQISIFRQFFFEMSECCYQNVKIFL